MDAPTIELEELRRLAWSGISHRSRAKAWKILCGYLPGNSSRQHEVIQRKQEEYFHCVEQYFLTKDEDVHQVNKRGMICQIQLKPVVSNMMPITDSFLMPAKIVHGLPFFPILN